jgi:hypothetical protein
MSSEALDEAYVPIFGASALPGTTRGRALER